MWPTTHPGQPFLRPLRSTRKPPSYKPNDYRPSAGLEYALQRNTIHHRPENTRHPRHLRDQRHERKPTRIRQATTRKLRAKILVRSDRRDTPRRNPRKSYRDQTHIRDIQLPKPAAGSYQEENPPTDRVPVVDGKRLRTRDRQSPRKHTRTRLQSSIARRRSNSSDSQEMGQRARFILRRDPEPILRPLPSPLLRYIHGPRRKERKPPLRPQPVLALFESRVEAQRKSILPSPDGRILDRPMDEAITFGFGMIG